jgi:transposase
LPSWLGVTPRQDSTGGKQRLGKISREGDEDLRRLLVLGATSVIRTAKPGRAMAFAIAGAQVEEGCGGRAGQQSLPRRRPGMARILWAMMISGKTYRRPAKA